MSEIRTILEEFHTSATGLKLNPHYTEPLDQAEKALTAYVEERERNIAKWLEYKPNVFNEACNQCGGKMAEIRPQHPGGEKRTVCPTCLDDIRLDAISNLTSQPAKAELQKGKQSQDKGTATKEEL